MITIFKKWHKANDFMAITYNQLSYINDLRNDDNCPSWPFRSSTQAMRSLTKEDGSEIIDAMQRGEVVVFE